MLTSLTAQQAHPVAENRILSALSAEDYERLTPRLEPVVLTHGQILHTQNDLIDYVYFPTNGMISLVSLTSDGSSVEVGTVGFEGMTGLSIILGVERPPHETLVQLPGDAMRLRADLLLEEFKRGGALHNLLLRYTQSLIHQISQIAACNRLHLVEERLARWLLMSHDRYEGESLPLTQEFIATMLGVRRAGVTIAASALQTEGYINYKRGHITVKDREGLEYFACECYQIVKEEFDRLNNGTKNAGGLKLIDKKNSTPSKIEPYYPSSAEVR